MDPAAEAGSFFIVELCMPGVSLKIILMAEIHAPSNAADAIGVGKSKKLSTRVDLTPMDDLGFLLITFFVFTTTISEPRALNLVIPANGDSTQSHESKTLNLILSADNKVHFYVGKEVGKMSCTDFSPQGVRKVIGEMQKQVRQRFGENEHAVVLIRPTEASSYMNLVDILDEMLIMNVRKYALMDSPPKELLSFTIGKRPC